MAEVRELSLCRGESKETVALHSLTREGAGLWVTSRFFLRCIILHPISFLRGVISSTCFSPICSRRVLCSSIQNYLILIEELPFTLSIKPLKAIERGSINSPVKSVGVRYDPSLYQHSLPHPSPFLVLLIPPGKSNYDHYHKWARFEVSFFECWPGQWTLAISIPRIPRIWWWITLVRGLERPTPQARVLPTFIQSGANIHPGICTYCLHTFRLHVITCILYSWSIRACF